MHYEHWLVTRFNVPRNDCLGRSLDPAWLEHRARLFITYCLSSVCQQLCQDFRWLLLLDRDTPRSYVGRVFDWRRERTFEILPVGIRWLKDMNDYLASQCRAPYLITSRLDSDDAIHDDYMHAAQRAFEQQEFEFVEMPHGWKWDESRRTLSSDRNPSGPFLTLIERRTGPPKTVHCCEHRRASDFGVVRQIDLDPAWLQVIHGGNIMNRIEHNQLSLPLAMLDVGFPGLRLTRAFESRREETDHKLH